MNIDISQLDTIYLSYDEPNREEYWAHISAMVPWAKHVTGVKGSDSAHKQAAVESETERFILIDGDNIPDDNFFNLTLQLDDSNKDCVFRWKARNHINGLTYGNGGLSCWTKDFVHNMRTHELSDGSADTAVEFCFDPKYIAMHDAYSTTYPNQSPFHAWRAGFREGVKMCLDRGVKPSLKEFEQRVHQRNYDNLCIWQNVGRDVPYGDFAMLGARFGTYYTMILEEDYTVVQDFDRIGILYGAVILPSADFPQSAFNEIGSILKRRLGLPIVDLNAEQSAFFKKHVAKQHINKGVMTYDV
jgi:hypothetical protein